MNQNNALIQAAIQNQVPASQYYSVMPDLSLSIANFDGLTGAVNE